MNEIKHVMVELLERFTSLKDYNLTEAFLINGELHMTSEYDFSWELYFEAEKYALAL